MENSTALIIAENLDPVKVFTGGGLEAVLKEIEEKVAEFEPDLSTTASRKEIASMAHKVSRSKILIDDLGKFLAADWKKKVKTVDIVRKEARDFCDNLRDEVREPLSAWEAEETLKDEARIAAIKERIEGFWTPYSNLQVGSSSDQIKAAIAEIEAVKIEPEEFFEFTAEAAEVRETVLSHAKRYLETKERLEREKAEQKKETERLAVERKKQDEITAKQKAAQDKIDAAARKVAEEKAELERDKKADQERKDREEFERKAKIQAEKDALAKAMREKQEEADAEQQAKEDDLRREALRPDKEKFSAWIDSFNYYPLPTVEDEALKDLIRVTMRELEIVLKEALIKAKKL